MEPLEVSSQNASKSFLRFASFPSEVVRGRIASTQWDTIVESWIALVERLLLLPEDIFSLRVNEEGSSMTSFLSSYLREASQSWRLSQPFQNGRNGPKLHRVCFLLCHRILNLKTIPLELLDCGWLGLFCAAYHSCEGVIRRLKQLLQAVWEKEGPKIDSTCQRLKRRLVTKIQSGDSEEVLPVLQELVPLIEACPPIGEILATGSDLLDSIIEIFPNSSETQHIYSVFVYTCLVSLTSDAPQNRSLFSEYLYTLKANAGNRITQGSGKKPKAKTLLHQLACNTKFLHQIQAAYPGLLASIQDFIPKSSKGKHKAIDPEGESDRANNTDTIYVIKAAAPQFSIDFIKKVLNFYKDPETTLHVLETHNIPAELSHLSQYEPNFELTEDDVNTEFVREGYKLRIARAADTTTADDLLNARPTDTKEHVTRALATFDPYDDERDDTYDAADVGGTVDTSVDTADRGSRVNFLANSSSNNSGGGGGGAFSFDPPVEMALYQAWKARPGDFARDRVTRSGAARRDLMQRTGLAHEQIEGWAWDVGGNERKRSTLERMNVVEGPRHWASSSADTGAARQEGLAGEEDGGEEAEGGPASGESLGGSAARRGRGGRGRGGKRRAKDMRWRKMGM